jgi:FkbM family methyltransferase
MSLLIKIRRSLTWLAHCYKAVFNNYHQQLLPLCQIILKQDDLVIDVGAQAGQLSKIFSRYVPLGRILAVEPGQYSLSILSVVKLIRRLPPVFIISKGVGDKPGKATLRTPLKKSGVLRFGLSKISTAKEDDADKTTKNEHVVITTIDSLIEEHGENRNFSLLKADIEGHEYKMLCGAVNSIEKSKPCLLLEISNDKEKILHFLLTRNYTVLGLVNYGGKETESLRLVEISKDEEVTPRNILAVNNSKKELLRNIKNHFC